MRTAYLMLALAEGPGESLVPALLAPDLDPRAKAKLIEVMTTFTDAEALKSMENGGPLIPAQTEMYDFVRRSETAARAWLPSHEERPGGRDGVWWRCA